MKTTRRSRQILLVAVAALLALVACKDKEKPTMSEADFDTIRGALFDTITAVHTTEATLFTQTCPDILTGCGFGAFQVDGVCFPVTIAPGTCQETPIRVRPGQSYQIAACAAADCSNCGSSITMRTPILILGTAWFHGNPYYCASPCGSDPACP